VENIAQALARAMEPVGSVLEYVWQPGRWVPRRRLQVVRQVHLQPACLPPPGSACHTPAVRFSTWEDESILKIGSPPGDPGPDVSRYGNRVDQPVRTRQAKPGKALADKVPWLVTSGTPTGTEMSRPGLWARPRPTRPGGDVLETRRTAGTSR
jgi:hypothetical protein